MHHFRQIISLLIALALLTTWATPSSTAIGHAAPISAPAQQTTPTPWVTSATHNGIVYFAFATPRRIERFRLSDATWLTPLDLPPTYILVESPPSALAVDDDGIFIAFGLAIYRMALDGTAATALTNAGGIVEGLHLLGSYVFATYQVSSDGRVLSLAKADGARIQERSTTYRFLAGSAMMRGRMALYGRTTGISPGDILMLPLSADGAIGAVSESPYHGAYPNASRVFPFPDETKVADTSGIVYNASNLTYNNSLAGGINDLAFNGNLPIALRANKLIAFSSNMLEMGRLTLNSTPRSIVLSGQTIYAFAEGGSRGVTVEGVAIGDLSPLQPGAPVDPNGLSYAPDHVSLASDGVVYILSRANLSIFRWDTATRRYLPTIPLVEAPSHMAVDEANLHIYLSYPGGRISRIRLSVGTAEEPFANAPLTTCGMAMTDIALLVCDPVGAWVSHLTYNQDGVLISSREWNYSSAEFIWSAANRRVYFLRDNMSPTDLHAEQIGLDGTIVAMSETPYHDSTGITYPIRVAPDGSVVILGSGRVFHGTALTNLTPLSNTISDAAWGSDLFTIRAYQTGSQIQRWAANYTLAASATLSGTPIRLFRTGAGMLAIVNRDGVPQFTLWDEGLNRIFESPPDKAIRGLSVSSSSPTLLGSATTFSAQVAVGTGVAFSWDFGDGVTAEGASVSHTYSAVGSYTAQVVARNAINEQRAQVTVRVNEPPLPTMVVLPSKLSFAGVLGYSDPPSQQFTISHDGPIDLAWHAAADAPWISLNRITGAAPGTVLVTAATEGLPSGVYTGTITVRLADARVAPKLIPVMLTITDEPPPATLAVSPSSLAYNAIQGGALPDDQLLQITHDGPVPLSWSAEADRPWIVLRPSGGTGESMLEVRVNQTGLDPGTYTGTVRVALNQAGSQPTLIPVTIVVAASAPVPTMTVTPTSLFFHMRAGEPSPARQRIFVSHTGASDLTWSAEADAEWMLLTSGSGSSASEIEVAIDSAGLVAGSYTGSINVQLSDPRAAPKAVAVRLIVEAAEDPPIELSVYPGYHGMQLRWTPSHEPGVAQYRVLRGVVDGARATIASTRQTYYLDVDPSLQAGVSYCYQVESLRADGSVAARSGRDCATFGQIGLWIPDVWGTPGSLAVIPVNTHNVSGLQIAAADIWIDLDSRVAEPVSVIATPLSAGHTWSYGVMGTGPSTRVRIATLSDVAAPLAGDGSLFWLIVRVRGSAGASSPLNLRDYVTNVGGSTIYTRDNLSTPVPMFLEDGVFHASGSYCLGDLNGNGVPEAIDAYITLQIASGRSLPSPEQRRSGDVNGNGRIDSADATLILAYAANGVWPFQDGARPASRVSPRLAADTGVQIGLGAAAGPRGAQVSVPLTASGLGDWAGGRFVITYDPAVVSSIDSVSLGASPFVIQYYDDGAGMLTITVAGSAAHSAASSLLSIRLTLAADAPLGVSPLTLAEAQIHDDIGRDFATSALARTINWSDGSVMVRGASPTWVVNLPHVQH